MPGLRRGLRMGTRRHPVVRTARRYVIDIAKLFGDNEEEIQELIKIGYTMCPVHKVSTLVDGSIDRFRAKCIEREVNKCIDCDVLEDGQKLADMLTSKDKEMSQLGMEIFWGLREKRLKISYEIPCKSSSSIK